MSCLLQTPGGDIDMTAGRTTTVSDPVQAGCIKLRNRLGLFYGEWFRDQRIGVPWFQKILVKNANIPLIQNILRSIIISTPPFVAATVTVTPPNASRSASASFVATVDPKVVPGGATVTAASLDQPFIINIPAGAT